VDTKRRYIIFLALFLSVFLLPSALYPRSIKDGPHGDKRRLPNGCGSCHKGHGKYDTPMLPEKRDVFCFRCHGHSKNVDETRKKGDLSRDTKSADLQKEFEKPHHHPIEKVGVHRYNETLPETDPSIPRHSECGDCHHYHYVTSENKMAGIGGINRNRAKVQSVSFEYELCFKCHSNSANLPSDQTDKVEQFDVSNPSYHPVVAPGRNNDVPSLIHPLTPSSTIKCTDCHNNDDPKGPRGPHGSIYRYILTRNYTTSDGQEGPFQYDLCYGCHRRSSILGNESFTFHSLHISSVGTSCRTCHNSHGSREYTHLIDLDNPYIRPSNSGRLEFIDLGRMAGECYLSCHGKNHDPEVYPASLKPKEIPGVSPFQNLPGTKGFRNR